MLIITQLNKTPSVERLVKLWAKRYMSEVASFYDPLSPDQNHKIFSELVKVASLEGRVRTTAKLHQPLIDVKSRMALTQAEMFYTYIPNILDFQEALRLAKYVSKICIKLLTVYQQATFISPSQTSMWEILDIEQLAKELEPILVEYQEQHIASHNWRALGFITTLWKFNNKSLLRSLAPIEQAFFNPYLKFVEEQVSIPWQRVCAVAARHELSSPTFTLVEQMIPLADEIAQAAYHRLTQSFPNYCSYTGRLTEKDVTHSILRDLNMFQAYLWLCVLEEDITPVEQELVKLCVMVMPSIEVKWELIIEFLDLLIDEINSRLTKEQSSIVQPYVSGMLDAFFKARLLLGATD
ncbi:hypothetical protein [Fischerella sp. PCC 9605]|uniref:hypothetical protein n=1 Tax=Fischerella sp. PCC 9605 TaxID=1173024 RepID=UPI00047BF008|nr:hypothetical protein [Fischerella sp. PCC 9605]